MMGVMAHFSTLLKVVIDVPPADHDRELAFRQGALGLPLPQFPLGYGRCTPGG
jgi:hypothetical protein